MARVVFGRYMKKPSFLEKKNKKTEGSFDLSCALCLETLEMYKNKTNRVSVYGYNTNIRINMNKQHLIFELEL